MKQNYFQSRNKIYGHNTDTPMGPSISRITARIFVQTMINASKLEYTNLNAIYSTKHIYDKLGETSREDTRNTSII